MAIAMEELQKFTPSNEMILAQVHQLQNHTFIEPKSCHQGVGNSYQHNNENARRYHPARRTNWFHNWV